MPARKLVLLLLVGAMILGGIMMMRSYAPTEGGTSGTQLMGAATDLPMGTLLKETDVKWVAAKGDTTGLLVQGSADKSAAIGGVLKRPLHAEEPVGTEDVVHPHEQGFLAAVLAPGKRAISLPITPVGSVAGFVFPGDHVDVILTHKVERKDDPDMPTRRVSETVLSDVRVLALDQKTESEVKDIKPPQTATLEVTPKQAEKVALLTELGTLSLVLRSLADKPEDADGKTASDAPASATKTYTWDSDVSRVLPKPDDQTGTTQKIEVIRGKDKTEAVFDRR